MQHLRRVTKLDLRQQGGNVAPKKSLLEKMRANPAGDWSISDIAKVCRENGVNLQAPHCGSHYKAVSPHLPGHQTVPYKRPIKPFYIESLVAMIDAHILRENTKDQQR